MKPVSGVEQRWTTTSRTNLSQYCRSQWTKTTSVIVLHRSVFYYSY